MTLRKSFLIRKFSLYHNHEAQVIQWLFAYNDNEGITAEKQVLPGYR